MIFLFCDTESPSNCHFIVTKMVNDLRIGLALLMFLIGGTASAAEMDGAELEAALVGQSIRWWEKGGWASGELTFLPDGRAEIVVSTSGNLSDTGRWHILGNSICTNWSRLRGEATKCYTVDRIGPNRFATSGGNIFEVVFSGA